MPSIKQLQHRLLDKKNSLNKVNSNIAHTSSGTSSVVLRRLNQEKGALGRDIRNLERQLVTMENASRELKSSTDKIDGD